MLLFSFPGEAYEALVSFLDENEPSWRSSLRGDMIKAVRGDGKVCVRETKEGFCPTVPGTACVRFCFGIEPGSTHRQPRAGGNERERVFRAERSFRQAFTCKKVPLSRQ